MINLSHVKKVYPNGYEAIREFNLDIEDNEFLVLVGPSGCGKSTLLRMIAGLEEVSSGSIIMDGKEISHLEPKERNIAMVFQDYALYPHMTVYDNIAFSLKMRRIERKIIEKKVHEAAAILELEDYLQRKPGDLSGGQRQRVAMGRAIVREPKVFLMDEPLSNLDAKLRVQMREEIAQLHQRLNTTFIYVTHDQTEAMTLGTRVVVMNKGEIEQVDSPQHLYENPAKLFVASFIGAPKMNLLEAKLENDKSSSDNTNPLLKFADSQLSLSADQCTKIQNYFNTNTLSESVILGIRPEHIDLLESSEIEEDVFQAELKFYEMLGDEGLIYCNFQGVDLRILHPHQRYFNKGEKINIRFKLEQIHLFDPNSGKAIL